MSDTVRTPSVEVHSLSARTPAKADGPRRDRTCCVCRRPRPARAFDVAKALATGAKALKCTGCGDPIPLPEKDPAFLRRNEKLAVAGNPPKRDSWPTTPLHLVGYSGSGSMFGNKARQRF